MAHLLNVCKILAERDCEDEVLSAALLHDIVEDTEITIQEVEDRFGKRIAEIVRGCTEQDKLEKQAMDKRASWKERKQHTIHFLKTEATDEQLLVAAADKLDNLRSIAYDQKRIGEAIWKRFNASKEQQHWYYLWIADAFEKRANEKNVVLRELAAEMKALCRKVFEEPQQANEPDVESQTLLDKATQIALTAHKNQFDKFAAPYAGHITRVMNSGTTTDEKIVGILHDLVEDTDWTFEKLEREGFPSNIISALRCVTKTNEEENYEQFIQRIKENPLAVRVKLNDLRDNMDITRMPEVTEKDLQRLNKYLKAYRELGGKST